MVWKRLDAAIKEVIDGITLADLVEEQMKKSDLYVI
jgi:DNA-binding IscR family transcriptional regulator